MNALAVSSKHKTLNTMKTIDTEIGTSYGHGPRQGVPYKPENTMKTQFTPGPWHSQYRQSTCAIVADTENGAQLVASINHDADPRTAENNPNAMADARLIAAAPELLAALQAACNDIELILPLATGGDCSLSPKGEAETRNHIALYRAAIAKALGQQEPERILQTTQ